MMRADAAACFGAHRTTDSWAFTFSLLRRLPWKETDMKIKQPALQEVEAALERYKREVEETGLAPNTIKTYVLHAEHFVRWLKDDFEPGGTLR